MPTQAQWMQGLRTTAWFWLGAGLGPIPLVRMHAVSAQMREEIGIVGLIMVVAALCVAFAAFVASSVLRFGGRRAGPPKVEANANAATFERWP